MIKKKLCKHEWTQPSDRQEQDGSNGAYEFFQVVYTICKKCATEKIISRRYIGKNYV